MRGYIRTGVFGWDTNTHTHTCIYLKPLGYASRIDFRICARWVILNFRMVFRLRGRMILTRDTTRRVVVNICVGPFPQFFKFKHWHTFSSVRVNDALYRFFYDDVVVVICVMTTSRFSDDFFYRLCS